MHNALLFVLFGYWVLSIEGLYMWKQPSNGQEHTMHQDNFGEYILRGLNLDELETPSPTQNDLSTLRIKRMPVPLRQVKRTNNFIIATASLPQQTDSIAINQDGTDYSYFSTLTFGSKALWMLIDTGAANSWVMGSDCSTIACNTHSTFGKADSPSLQVSQEPFSLNYGTGSVNGIVVTDVVGFADKMLEWSFGSASKTSEDFDTIPIDGILGLGRAKSNVMGVPTFMEAVSDANLFSANLFGVHLQREADGSIDGEINFGHPDTTKYTGDLSYTDTIADGANWEIPVDDAFVNGFSCGLKGNTAIIDTGTSFILLPPDDAKQINAKIPGFKQVGETYHIPCDANVSIQIVFSSIGYSISPKDYIGKPVTGSDLCSSNIIGEAIGDNQWLLGDTFLKNVYAVFDIDQSRIGFGVKGTISFTSGSPSTSMFSTISSTSTETHLSSAVISKTTPSSSKMTTSAITAAPVSLLSESAALANPTSTNTADLGSSTSSVPTTTESSTPRSSTSSINPSATTLSNGITAKSVSDHRRLWLALLLLQLCMIKFI